MTKCIHCGDDFMPEIGICESCKPSAMMLTAEERNRVAEWMCKDAGLHRLLVDQLEKLPHGGTVATESSTVRMLMACIAEWIEHHGQD